VEKIRILEVVSGLGMGGAEKALSARIKYIPQNFECTILNIRPEIDSLSLKGRFSERKIMSKGLFRLYSVIKFLRTSQFDVFIVRTPMDAIRFGFVRFFFRRMIPNLIFEAHSNFATKKFGFNLFVSKTFGLISKEIDLTIAVSKNVRMGPLCKKQKRVEVLYLGSDLKPLPLKGLALSHPRLIFVGRLIDLKRPDWLLERIINLKPKIEFPEGFLTIVGSGPLENQLKNLIQTNGLGQIVRLAGFKDDVAPFYADATHLVSCSTNEGLPITFYEAKLAGLSILATPSGGGSEIFTEDDLELKSFKEEEFEQALEQILHSTDFNINRREAIRTKSLWMSANKSSQRYYRLIEELVNF
jgi:glycosyltransferase involved in cell wall biosynthesis